MAIVHAYTKYQDIYTLRNQGVDSFTYTLNRISCDNEVLVATGTLLASQNYTVPAYEDGMYSLVLTQGEAEPIIIPILNYVKLVKSFIADVQDILCGCKCKDCDCDDKCENTLLALTKGATYFTLNNEELCSLYNCVANFTNCNIEDSALCLLTQEFILGSGKPDRLIQNLIATYYITFYFNELNIALDAAEVNYVKAKYNSDVILPCLRKLGFNVADILCNPPIPGPESTCVGWTWDLTAIVNPNTQVGLKYYDCETNAQIDLIGTIDELGSRTIDFCSNGITPTFNAGTIQSTGECTPE